MFLHNAWYVAGWTEQFRVGELVARTIVDQPIVLFRTQDGTIRALEDRCCHRFAPLSLGRQESDDIRCMYHGLKFAPSGICVEVPTRDTVPAGLAVRPFPATERDRWVWVWMGDTERADPRLIPRAIGHEDADYRLLSGEMRYEANFQLIHDNLLDLTHLGFLHEATFGRKGTKWGHAEPSFRRLDNGVRVQRWLPEQPVANYIPAEPGVPMDQWASHDFIVPGLFRLTVASYSAGTAAGCPDGPGVLAPDFVSMTSHAVTPVGSGSSICYYTVGQLSRHSDADGVARQMRLFERAFVEDRDMLEAQQRNVDRAPDAKMLTLSFDQMVFAFRRLMARLIEAEAARGH